MPNLSMRDSAVMPSMPTPPIIPVTEILPLVVRYVGGTPNALPQDVALLIMAGDALPVTISAMLAIGVVGAMNWVAAVAVASIGYLGFIFPSLGIIGVSAFLF